MIKKYIEYGHDIKLIVVMANLEFGLKKSDLRFLREIDRKGRPMLVVLSKSDNIKNEDEMKEKVFKVTGQIKEFRNMLPQVHIVSPKTGEGIEELGIYLSTYFLITEEEEMQKTKLDQIAGSGQNMKLIGGNNNNNKDKDSPVLIE